MSRLTLIVAATKSNGIGVNGGLPWKLSKELKYFAQATTAAPAGQQNAVIMGRNTWESIPARFRPLPRRRNVVVSRNPGYVLGAPKESGALLTNSLEAALAAAAPPAVHRAFIIGGATLYNEALALPVPSRSTSEGASKSIPQAESAPPSDSAPPSESAPPSDSPPYVDRILLTRILAPAFDACDVFMPDFAAGGGWRQAPHAELEAWVGFAVPGGTQEEGGVQYAFQMWVRE